MPRASSVSGQMRRTLGTMGWDLPLFATATAMDQGGRLVLNLVAAVVLGPALFGTWVILALLLQYAGLTEVLRLAGGGYLLWLAVNALRSALQDTDAAPAPRTGGATGLAYFSKGLAIHLTNPKSVFAWVAIIAIGVTPQSPTWTAFAIVGGCWLMGMVIFGGFALVFSTPRMAGAYGRFSRVIRLPYRVDPDRVEARMTDGVLQIELHRPDEDKPRRVRINAN